MAERARWTYCGAHGSGAGDAVLIDSEVTGNSPYGIAAIADACGSPTVTLEGTSSVHDNVPDDCVGTTAC